MRRERKFSPREEIVAVILVIIVTLIYTLIVVYAAKPEIGDTDTTIEASYVAVARQDRRAVPSSPVLEAAAVAISAETTAKAAALTAKFAAEEATKAASTADAVATAATIETVAEAARTAADYAANLAFEATEVAEKATAVAEEAEATLQKLAMPDSEMQAAAISAAEHATIAVEAAGVAKTSADSAAEAAEEKELLEAIAKIVFKEARGESEKGQVAVAASVVNRLAKQPEKTLEEIITPPKYANISRVTEEQLAEYPECLVAAKRALQGEDPFRKALGGPTLYFYNPDTSDEDELESRKDISVTVREGNHVFYSVWD